MLLDFQSFSDLMFITWLITSFVTGWVFSMLALQLAGVGFRSITQLDSDSDWMEFYWTIIPCWAVTNMCFHNMSCLLQDDYVLGAYMINVVARQWYWSYEDRLFGGYYDSIMNDFIGDVEKPLRLFEGFPVVLAMTSADVIHSFALPDFFFKADVMPGRLGYHSLIPEGCGVYVGYCSELCGAGHAFMPIVAEVIDWVRLGRNCLGKM